MGNVAVIDTIQLLQIDDRNHQEGFQCLQPQTRNSLDSQGYHTLADYTKSRVSRDIFHTVLFVKVEGTFDNVYERIDITRDDMDCFQVISWEDDDV